MWPSPGVGDGSGRSPSPADLRHQASEGRAGGGRSVGDNLTDVSPESFELSRVGGGWTPSITYVEESIFYPDRNSVRGHNYALVSGLIYRWNRGWQGFEVLVAEKCGRQSTLLLGIDKDTGAGYLYAMSHANGTSTIIQSLGKVSGGNFTDPAYARFWRITGDPTGALNGD